MTPVERVAWCVGHDRCLSRDGRPQVLAHMYGNLDAINVLIKQQVNRDKLWLRERLGR